MPKRLSFVQDKLVVALKEYRSLYSQQAVQQRAAMPMNLLIYPPSLRYLPLWTLGTTLHPSLDRKAHNDWRSSRTWHLQSTSSPTLSCCTGLGGTLSKVDLLHAFQL